MNSLKYLYRFPSCWVFDYWNFLFDFCISYRRLFSYLYPSPWGSRLRNYRSSLHSLRCLDRYHLSLYFVHWNYKIDLGKWKCWVYDCLSCSPIDSTLGNYRNLESWLRCHSKYLLSLDSVHWNYMDCCCKYLH